MPEVLQKKSQPSRLLATRNVVNHRRRPMRSTTQGRGCGQSIERGALFSWRIADVIVHSAHGIRGGRRWFMSILTYMSTTALNKLTMRMLAIRRQHLPSSLDTSDFIDWRRTE